MPATVDPKWGTDKFQCHGDSVVRFGPGAAAAARPRQRPAAAVPAGGGPARGNPEWPAARRRAAALIPGTDQPDRLGDAGGGGGVPGSGGAAGAPGAAAAAADRGLPHWSPRPGDRQVG